MTAGDFHKNGHPDKQAGVHFYSTLRDELLNGEVFTHPERPRAMTERSRQSDNTLRPHSALRYQPLTPETAPSLIDGLLPPTSDLAPNHETLRQKTEHNTTIGQTQLLPHGLHVPLSSPKYLRQSTTQALRYLHVAVWHSSEVWVYSFAILVTDLCSLILKNCAVIL
ncbi:MAG: transposase [candidate division Zixibacteria bacterium]|nr:transposase [candidate division Zixibacteria bacterium]